MNGQNRWLYLIKRMVYRFFDDGIPQSATMEARFIRPCSARPKEVGAPAAWAGRRSVVKTVASTTSASRTHKGLRPCFARCFALYIVKGIPPKVKGAVKE